jgi:hypothetical protein
LPDAFRALFVVGLVINLALAQLKSAGLYGSIVGWPDASGGTSALTFLEEDSEVG